MGEENIDELIAAKVMGWKILASEDHQGDYDWWENPANYPHLTRNGEHLLLWMTPRADDVYFNPSQCIGDAMMVLERTFPNEDWSIDKFDGKYALDIGYGNKDEDRICCDTLPMAICRAVLARKQRGEQLIKKGYWL